MSDPGPETPERETPERQALSIARISALLSAGEIELEGQFPWSSNYTFLATVRDDELQALAVYKPSLGERPLWDFESSTLCQREVAAYLVSRVLGWPDVPPVVLRDGPHGRGSVQLFVEADYNEHYFTLREEESCVPAFRRMALFDYVVNNADRKGGHVLKGAEGQIWAIDHGLTFHEDYHLRTVIWEHAGQPIEEPLLGDLRALQERLAVDDDPLVDALLRLIDHVEVAALRRRLASLIRRGRYPLPHREWRNVPYPLV